MSIEKICKEFGISGDIESCDIIRSGHINDTLKVNCRNGNSYIVQQINTYVFKNPERMMDNIFKVTSHISKKLGAKTGRMVLEFLRDRNGKSCHFDEELHCWRAYKFIDNSVTYDTCDNLEVLEQTGIAFGRFQMMLDDFDASELFETIEDFHDTEKRMATLFKHAEENMLGRAADASAELKFFRENLEETVKLTAMQKAGMLPVRVTHNDTKCNNVLFDTETHEALAVIDLDTVMPGLALHDFGDAVRFCANTAAEDETNLSKVSIDLDKFRALSRGYLSVAGNVLKDVEISNLVHGAFAITMEIAGRFLDDYLTGDRYFKTDYPGHNLDRCRSQLALAKDILKKYDELNAIIKELI